MIFSHPTLTFSQKNLDFWIPIKLHEFFCLFPTLTFFSSKQAGYGQVMRLISRRAPGYVLLALPERQHGASDRLLAGTRDPEKKTHIEKHERETVYKDM